MAIKRAPKLPSSRRWKTHVPDDREAPKLPYDILEIECTDDVNYLCEQAQTMKICSVDSETNSQLDTKKGKTYFDWAQGARAFMATFSASDDTVFACYDFGLVKEIMAFLEDSQTPMVLQNLKFDFHHFREAAGWIPRDIDIPVYDTMFGFRHKFPLSRAALKPASARYVTEFDTEYWQKKVTGWLGHEQGVRAEGKLWYQGREPSFQDVPKELMLPYASTDAYLTLMSYYGLKEDGAFDLPIVQQETKLAQLLVFVEKSGWRIKREVLDKQLEIASEQLTIAAKKFQLICPGLDPHSSDQVAALMYGTLGQEVIFRTDKDKPAATEQAIQQMTEFPIIRDSLLDVRHWTKLHNTLLMLRKFISSDGAVHTVLSPESAVTGRFGSANPALQNIVSYVPHEPWTHARTIFGPEEGFEHLFADYKQIELVIFADYVEDPKLDEAIIKGLDLHATTASGMFGIPFAEAKANKEIRDLGKGMNFTIIFGAGVDKIAGMLKYGGKGGAGKISEDRIPAILGHPGTYKSLAKMLQDRYYEGFPNTRIFIKTCQKNVQKRNPTPWVKNAFGRVVHLDRGFEYKAVNYIIQGSAADLMKNAMLRTWRACEQFCRDYNFRPWIDVQQFICIHDDIGFKVPAGYSERLATYIAPAMCNFSEFRLPIRVSCAKVTAETNWATKEEFDWESFSNAA